ncbi:MAG: ADP-heptose:LPS heptosyltransferase [Bacteroidetes bacterium]|nr:ADP-heptose:LPS heptosyltransferase [Bacteroidota bacterium]
MLLRSYTKAVAIGYEGLDSVLEYDGKSFFEMLRAVRLERFDMAVVAFPRFRVALLMLMAGIPARIGSGYRWYSFLFNKRVYEHRKTGERHEAEYNVRLLQAAGCKVDASPRPVLKVGQTELEWAKSVLKDAGIYPGDRWVVLHPGSGGSARDWSPKNFGELARVLMSEGFKVVVTGGPHEDQVVATVVEGSGNKAIGLVNRFTLREFAAFLSCANLFVGNSSGPLHIAAAAGTPVIGFYPDIVACSPKRWGPLTDKKIVFVPDRNKCPLCKGGECQSIVCMDQIEVSHVMSAVHSLISSRETASSVGVH